MDFILFGAIVAIVLIATPIWQGRSRTGVTPSSTQTGTASQHDTGPTAQEPQRVQAATGRHRQSKATPATPATDQGAEANVVGDQDVPIQPLRIVPARYNEAARAAGFHGKIFAVVIVNEYGKVDRLEYTAPVPFDLEDGPIPDAVNQWLFKPAKRAGKPVPSRVVMEVPFH